MSADGTLAGAVLAGGASRRMGTDKALIRVGGVTMVERAVAALEAAGARRTIVVGGADAALRKLGLGFVADRRPGEGPLAGIITALEAVEQPILAIMACDLLDPSPDGVRFVHDRLGEADVAVPVVDGREQWLHSVWRRTTLPSLERAFAAGVRAPRRALEGLAVARVGDGEARWFADADRPEDLPVDATGSW